MPKMMLKISEQKLRFIINHSYDVGANNEPAKVIKLFTKELIKKLKVNENGHR